MANLWGLRFGFCPGKGVLSPASSLLVLPKWYVCFKAHLPLARQSGSTLQYSRSIGHLLNPLQWKFNWSCINLLSQGPWIKSRQCKHTEWARIHPSKYHSVFSSYLLYLGSNLVLPDCWWVTDAHRARGRCFGIETGPPRPQLNSFVIKLYWAPGPKSRASQKCTCPQFSLLRGPTGIFGQCMMKTRKAGVGWVSFGGMVRRREV